MYGKYPTLVPAEGIIFTWTGQNREGYADLNDWCTRSVRGIGRGRLQRSIWQACNCLIISGLAKGHVLGCERCPFRL